MKPKKNFKIKIIPIKNKAPELIWDQDMVDIRFFESTSFGCENPFKHKELR